MKNSNIWRLKRRVNDVALEINGYDMLHYHSLVRRLAKACLLHHTPISVGSDAHNPRRHSAGTSANREYATRTRNYKDQALETDASRRVFHMKWSEYLTEWSKARQSDRISYLVKDHGHG